MSTTTATAQPTRKLIIKKKDTEESPIFWLAEPTKVPSYVSRWNGGRRKKQEDLPVGEPPAQFTKTFLMLTPQEIDHDYEAHRDFIDSSIFTRLLISHGWHKIYYDNNLRWGKYFKYGIGFTYRIGNTRYNKIAHRVPMFIQNQFDKDVYRSMTNKYELYRMLTEKGHTKYLAESWLIEDVPKKINFKKDMYLFKPINGYGGRGIQMITSAEELQKAKVGYDIIKQQIEDGTATPEVNKIYKSGVMISKYLKDILLFRGLKFHFRVYVLITAYYMSADATERTWSYNVFPMFKILTASQPYKKAEWDNKEIHDTHVHSTAADYYFPDNFPMEEKNRNKIYRQVNKIAGHIFEIYRDDLKEPFYPNTRNSFEVMGLDIMVGDDFRAYLIEANHMLGYHVYDHKDPIVYKFNKTFYNWLYQKAIAPLEPQLLDYPTSR